MFLGAGSVMHGKNDEVNMRKYGGLRKAMPITFITFGLGYLAIIGVPPFAGFYSKDEIIATAFNSGGAQGIILGSITLLGAVITAFYMTRVMVLTFTSKARWDAGVHPHESPALMWLPMAILAIGSVTAGYLFTQGEALVHWLSPLFAKKAEYEELMPHSVVSILAITAVLIGVSIALIKYQFKPVAAIAPSDVSFATRLARNDLGQDVVNEAIFMRPGQGLTQGLVVMDEKVIDGAVRGIGAMAVGSGATLRRTQSGYVRSYAALILVAALVLLAGIWVVTQ
jgi:NADH-quinone oxidoreductase subunit L